MVEAAEEGVGGEDVGEEVAGGPVGELAEAGRGDPLPWVVVDVILRVRLHHFLLFFRLFGLAQAV